MSQLEELPPELAGAFATQESALDDVITTLTTQLVRLASDHSRALARVQSLETKETELRQALGALGQAHEELQHEHAVQAERLASQSEQFAAQLRDIQPAAPEVNVPELQESLGRAIEAQATSLISVHLSNLETKFTTELQERLLETTHRLAMQNQQSEESLRAHIEMLEKRLEYISRVKMELKDLGKRIDKQDQALDDMRTGISLLAKSVGTDEIDDDSDHEQAPVDEMNDIADVPILVPQIPVVMIHVPEQDETTPIASESADDANEVEDSATQNTEADVNATATEDEMPSAASPVDGNQEALENSDASEPTATDSKDDEQPTETNPLPEVTPEISSEEATVMQPPAPQAEAEDVVEPVANAGEEVESERPKEQVEDLEPTTSPPRTTDPETTAASEELTQMEETTVVEQAVTEAPQSESMDQISNQPPTPEEESTGASAANVDELDEGEETDEFHETPVVAPQVVHVAPIPGALQHMNTAPSLSSIAYVRSRRQERFRRQTGKSTREQPEEVQEQRQSARVPLSREQIRELWWRVFSKIIQLRRLQSINGTSPERSLFRKQNLSMGARVKKLEENATDLEDTIEILELNLRNTGQSIQTLNQAIVQGNSLVDKKTKKLDEIQQQQAQSLLAIEEKLEAVEGEIRRVRNSTRRDSTRSSMSTAMFAQIGAQMHEATTRLNDLSSAFSRSEKMLNRLADGEVPKLTLTLEKSVFDLRLEVDFKTKELQKSFLRGLDQVQAIQLESTTTLGTRIANATEQIYQDLLVLTSSLLLAVELAKNRTRKVSSISGSDGVPETRKKVPRVKTPADVGISMLGAILASLEKKCLTLSIVDDVDATETLSVLLEKVRGFEHELIRLQEQIDNAHHVMGSANDISHPTHSESRGFEDHLALLSANYLRTFENILQQHGKAADPDHTSVLADALPHIKDLVVQIRAVLVLLLLHTQLVEPQEHVNMVEAAHRGLETVVNAHAFQLSQVGTIEAVVKMMGSRLDAFVELTLSFAKDADVKKLIQDLLSTQDDFREQVVQHVETTNSEAIKRDQHLEHEVSQLAGRVHKKLDKDEMLWTQEVLERRLQHVATSALGEADLVEIHRALRAKMDKNHVVALLQQQNAKINELESNAGATNTSANPLVGTHCISCNAELPPSKPELVAVVKEEVQQEVARAIARQMPLQMRLGAPTAIPSPLGQSGFQTSNHRSVDKHKKALLLASLQQSKQH